MREYINMLETFELTDGTISGKGSSAQAGLWAMLPLPAEEREEPVVDTNNFANNPLCTDRTPLVGLRKGGTDRKRKNERHSGTTVTVEVVSEGPAAVYGQYLTKESLSGSLRCDLGLASRRDHGFTDHVATRAVVDSGASWTAIRLDTLLATLPNAEASTYKLKFNESDITFVGVTGKQLICLGYTLVQIKLGPLLVETKAFVFPKMHEPMLLGMNTLHAANLSIDVGRMAMYESPSTPLPEGSVPLFVNDNAPPVPTGTPNDTKTDSQCFTSASKRELYFAKSGQVLATVACSRSPERSHKKGGSENASTINALAEATDTLTEVVQGDLTPRQRVDRLLLCEEMQAGDERLRPEDHLSTTRLLQDVTIRPGQTKPFHLYMQTAIPGPNRTLQIEPSAQFRAAYPELSTAGVELVFLHASAQRVAQYRMQNTSQNTIHIPADTPFGSAVGISLTDSNSFQLQHNPERILAILEDPRYQVDLAHLAMTTALDAKQAMWTLLATAMSTPGTFFDDLKSRTPAASPPPNPPSSTAENPPEGIHTGVFCDRSGQSPILGKRYHLRNEDYDLCEAEYNKLSDDEKMHYEEILPPDPDDEEDPNAIAEFEGIGASTIEFEYTEEADCRKLTFEQGGRPHTEEDLASLGLILDQAIDASHPDCPKIKESCPEDYQRLVDVCTQFGAVWSRDAKVPTPARHPWARCEINTGDAPPIQQKPYPIPQKYLPAVRKEVDGLLKAGLIEPGFGNWASPVICIVKKDSSASELRIKLAVDYRRLNASTKVDCARLGDQGDVLDCFHGRPHVSLADAAGGFYQFLIKEEDRQKTGFILPSSCGGTLFQWRVAPYGLTNMPAIYSRAMQHVLRGLVDVDLGYDSGDRDWVDPERDYLGVGSAPTWVDDITLASGRASPGMGIRGHIELLSRVFRRLILAGMTLKPSKTDLLRKELKVLGFVVTRDGIAPQKEKVQGILDIPTPDSPNAVLKFLGVINFQRRFVPRIGHIAHPLYELLKGYKSSELKSRRTNQPPRNGRPFNWTAECDQAFQEIKNIIAADCLNAHPDLTDPDAEFVMMTDASDRAAGAVLMQWQKAPSWSTEAPPVVEGQDGFDAAVARRLAAGYTLKTIGYYSKTFANAQVNWAIFDKEAASIIMAITNWYRLIAGRPIVVYTDNTVAASILTNTKTHRPARLQRWGVVLGTYLPLLRIAYRKGEDNPVADLLSRYRDNVNYKPNPSDFGEVPDDLYDHVVSLEHCGRKFLLSEAKTQVAIQEIWAGLGDGEEDMVEPGLSADMIGSVSQTAAHTSRTQRQLQALLNYAQSRWEAGDSDFARERAEAEKHLAHWAQYVQIFRTTYNRAPVLYDLYCGGGGFGRGAARAGFTVVGFDIRPRPPAYGRKGLGRTLAEHFIRETIQGMHYVEMDLDSEEFWRQLKTCKGVAGFPPPDVIHASPPCSPHSTLRHLPLAEQKESATTLTWLAGQLLEYQRIAEAFAHSYVPFSIENVVGARDVAQSMNLPISMLCGTMFGLKVFRHRLFITDTPLEVELECSHEGKGVGARGINRTGLSSPQYPPDALANMYAPYSWYQPSRGTKDELHEAMGMEPGAMSSYRDLTLALPPDYGEYVGCQLLAAAMRSNIALPLINYEAARRQPTLAEMMIHWSEHGYVKDRRRRQPTLSEVMIQEHGCVNDSSHTMPLPSSLERDLAAYRIQRYYRTREQFDKFTISEDRRALVRGKSTPGSNRHPALQAALRSRNTRRRGKQQPEATSSSDPQSNSEAPAAVETDDEPEPSVPQAKGRRQRARLQPTDHQDDGATPSDWKGPWTITLDQQLRDPELRVVYESLTVRDNDSQAWSPNRKRQARRHRARFCLHAGRINAMTADGLRLVVPAAMRYELVTLAHRTLDLGGHRGILPLYHHLVARYYWDGLLSDCEEVVNHCEVCKVRDMSHQLHPRFTAMPDPPHPFHTIYIDYKTVPGSKDETKNSILVIVDGLTRYVIAEPVSAKTAEITLKALVNRVFTVHSLPSVLRSDNGPEFDNALAKAFAAFAGYRHVRVLPYNAGANGKAESSVKRIQELLIKHCCLLDNWAETLPMVCFALNCVTHSGTGVSPFFALFGREPIMIPELEDPTGYRATYAGPEFLRNLVTELRRAWDTVRDSSEAVRASVIKRNEKSRRGWLDSDDQGSGCAGIHVGDWVLLKHGSDSHAKIRRKHGYPAYRRFRVVRVIPEARALELDVRGLNIHPVVSIRQCKPAPEAWYLFNDGSLSSGRYDGPLTLPAARGNPHEVGGRLPGDDPDEEPDTLVDDCVYPVEWILEAFHSKRRWWYRVLWLGYPTATWESEEDLEATAGDEVLEWMNEARKRFREKCRRRRTDDKPEDGQGPVLDSSIRDRDEADLEDEDQEKTDLEDEDQEGDMLDPFEWQAPDVAVRGLDIDCQTEPPHRHDDRQMRRIRRASQLSVEATASYKSEKEFSMHKSALRLLTQSPLS